MPKSRLLARFFMILFEILAVFMHFIAILDIVLTVSSKQYIINIMEII